MSKNHVVDVASVCGQLEELCNCLDLYRRGQAPQGEQKARLIARCLFELLGEDHTSIVSKPANTLATTYLRELRQDLPWQIEILVSDQYSESAWKLPTQREVESLRRWHRLLLGSVRTDTQDKAATAEQIETGTQGGRKRRTKTEKETLRLAVQELSRNGKSSIEIARELKISKGYASKILNTLADD